VLSEYLEDLTEELEADLERDAEQNNLDGDDEEADLDISNNTSFGSTDSTNVVTPSLSYVPCAAHHIQLVVRDALEPTDEATKKLLAPFHELVKKCAQIVKMSKQSSLIAAALAEYEKKLQKANATRWNATKMMTVSVDGLLSDKEAWNAARNALPQKTAKQKEAYKQFNVTSEERKMLKEFNVLLEKFESVTDEFQSDGVSISK
jgi:hypothetical protein